jgi:uncharacterized protein YbjT (DUF2867 family)
VSGTSVLLTGATGFVGRALFDKLRDEGHRIRCATRSPDTARFRFPDRQFVACDVDEPATLDRALEGIDVAYYLVHGMADSEGDYERREARAAESFLAAAVRCGVRRIVYLGGLRPSGVPSKHLRSRLRTGEILRSSSVSTIELRASMIVGEGSESFCIVRDIAARLPVMVLPRWLDNESQPVWIGDVTLALSHAATDTETQSRVFSLPGADRLSGRDMLLTTARVMGLCPVLFGVPLVTPTLSAGWISLITSANPRVAAELVQGFTSDIVSDDTAPYWPLCRHVPLGFEDSVRRALASARGKQRRSAQLVEGLVRRMIGSRV